jgi:hypothetical protein
MAGSQLKNFAAMLAALCWVACSSTSRNSGDAGNDRDVATDSRTDSQDGGQGDSDAPPADASVPDESGVEDGQPDTSNPDPGPADEGQTDAPDDDRMQVMFTINTHDWVFLEDSANTIARVLDIHEAYEVPVDIYLTDPMVQAYQQSYPELMTRLRDSDLVAVSYHVRPPNPYYPNFDHAGLSSMSEQELYDTVMDYETHALDLEWGVPSEQEGGYAYLTSLMGYAPPAVGTNSGGPLTGTIFRVFDDLGVTFQVVHGRHIDLGDRSHGALVRPEHVEIKLYEYRRGEEASEVIEAHIAEECGAATACMDTIYVNIKFHENNFYASNTTWWPVFFEDREKTTPLSPPFDLDASEGVVGYKPQTMIDNLWAVYEGAVQYVAENPERYRPINVLTLREETGSL